MVSRKPKTMYPWSKWLKLGAQHLLTKGIEYTCSTDGFVVYLYQVANNKGVKLSIFRVSRDTLLIEAHKGNQDGRSNWREIREEHNG